MPIIQIQQISDSAPPNHQVIKDIADQLANLWQLPKGKVWVSYQTIPVEQYAECGTELAETPRPIFVQVIRSKTPEESTLAKEVPTITDLVAQALQHPRERVHVLFDSSAAGRIAFGGKFVAS